MTYKEQPHILLIEDSIENIGFLTSVLNQYKVSVFKKGEKGLEFLRNTNLNIDIILLDIELPGINGYGVAKEVRQIEKYSEVPIIFITANTDKASLVKAFNNGGQDYITKPIDRGELLARIKTHLDLKLSNQYLKNLKEQLEAEVEKRTQDLSQTLEELDSYVYRASHDLKGPIASILGLINISYSMEQADDKADIIDKIKNRTLDLDATINKLIDKHTLINSTPNCSLSIRKVIDESIKECEYVNGNVSVIQNGEETNIKTDQKFLQVALINILENSNNFGAETVKISIDKVEEGCKVTILDDGEGMDNDVIKNADKLFYRGSEKSKGSGLGLHLAKEAINKLGGEMRISSKVDEYTKVELIIPNN